MRIFKNEYTTLISAVASKDTQIEQSKHSHMYTISTLSPHTLPYTHTHTHNFTHTLLQHKQCQLNYLVYGH